MNKQHHYFQFVHFFYRVFSYSIMTTTQNEDCRSPDDTAACSSSSSSSVKQPLHIAIVGAGIAGLSCARELLLSTNMATSSRGGEEQEQVVHVTVIEATDRVGGRIQKIPTNRHGTEDKNSKNHLYYLDAGAEFIHGRDHVLWDMIRDYQQRGLLPTRATTETATTTNTSKEVKDELFEYEGLEPYFILSHADGGPEENPTSHGKFGMYYMDDELLMYNDPKVQPLADALEAIFDPTKYDQYSDTTSVADALVRDEQIIPLSDSLLQLCVAGYGNTAGCCDLHQLSIRQLMRFEHYWETNEIEGDFRPLFGLHRVVDAMLQEIQEYNTEKSHRPRFELRLSTPVQRILPTQNTGEGRTTIQVQYSSSSNDEQHENSTHEDADESSSSSSHFLLADAVVVTVPPTRLSQIFDDGRDLPAAKRDALGRIGFADRVVKVCCSFQRVSCFWPNNVQSIIAAGQPIPEIWIRQLGENYYVIVGYLVSTSADQLMEQIQREIQQKQEEEEEEAGNKSVGKTSLRRREYYAGRIMLQQLSTMLKLPLEELEKEFLQDETLLVDWKEDFPYVQGGYMFPKIGMKTGEDLHALAEPIMDGHVFFAGEATNTNACCTAQAAMETGIRAAKEIKSRFL